jgi:hypothetical protein
MGEAHSSLLGHNSSDGTAAVSRLPIAIEGYEPLVQRRIVVVYLMFNFVNKRTLCCSREFSRYVFLNYAVKNVVPVLIQLSPLASAWMPQIGSVQIFGSFPCRFGVTHMELYL